MDFNYPTLLKRSPIPKQHLQNRIILSKRFCISRCNYGVDCMIWVLEFHSVTAVHVKFLSHRLCTISFASSFQLVPIRFYGVGARPHKACIGRFDSGSGRGFCVDCLCRRENSAPAACISRCIYGVDCMILVLDFHSVTASTHFVLMAFAGESTNSAPAASL